MLKIYGYAASINVRKVLWTCAEIGIEFEREDWGGGFRATATPEFRALNPFGMVPVIDDDGIILSESNVIVRYLAETRGRTDLLPRAPAARAQIERWMDWQVSDFNNSWKPVVQGLVRKNPDFQDPAMLERSRQEFNAMVAIVDQQLARHPFIAGDAFTAADIPIGLSVHRWYSTPIERPALAHVKRYYETLCERPGFATYGRDGGA